MNSPLVSEQNALSVKTMNIATGVYERSLIEGAPDPLIILSLEGSVTDLNQASEKLLALPRQEVIGLNFIDHCADEKEKVAASFASILASGTVRDVPLKLRDASGRSVPVLFNGALYYDQSGCIAGVIASARDMTERLETEARLSYLAAIVEHSEDAILGRTTEGTITSWNAAAQRIFGYTAAEIIGQPLTILIPPERLDEQEMLTDRLRHCRGVTDFETERLTRDGRRVPLALTLSPILDSEVRVMGNSAIYRDISERQESYKRRADFFSMVSHELRTPLTSIHAVLRLLECNQGGDLPDQAIELIKIARTESDRMIRLINDVLDLRKAEAGKMPLKRREVTLAELLRSAEHSVQGAALEAEVKLEIQPYKHTLVYCDPDRMVQALTNLLSNAIKFSPKGETVTLAIANQTETIRLAVTDKGPGIEPDKLPRLFGKFQQLQSGSHPIAGTGLGLAITKGIMEEHGGAVGVDTAPGKGATFWLDLPINNEDPPAGVEHWD